MEVKDILKSYENWSKDKKRQAFSSRIICASVLDSHSWGFTEFRRKCIKVLKKNHKIVNVGGQKYSLL